MSIFNLLLTNCKISNSVRAEILSLPMNSDETFVFSNEYRAQKTSEQAMHEIAIQNNLAKKSSKAILGYSFLRQRLQSLKPSTTVKIRFIESETWDGRAFESDGHLQGVLLGKKKLNPMKTPPNWDGNLEMLEKYNKLI